MVSDHTLDEARRGQQTWPDEVRRQKGYCPESRPRSTGADSAVVRIMAASLRAGVRNGRYNGPDLVGNRSRATRLGDLGVAA